MSVDSNKALVQRFFDTVLSEPDPAAAGQSAQRLIDPALIVHHPMLPGGTGHLADVMQLVAGFRNAFPDLAYTIEDLVGEGEKVAARWTARGTNNAPFLGTPPTHQMATVAGADLFLIRNDRIVETWVNSDMYGLMRQIGAVQ